MKKADEALSNKALASDDDPKSKLNLRPAFMAVCDGSM